MTDANKPEPPGKDGHMQDLEDAFRRHGIVVPITFNDWGPLRNFNKGLGSPDICASVFRPPRALLMLL